MGVLPRYLLPTIALIVGACGGASERDADSAGAGATAAPGASQAASVPAALAAPTAAVVVLYNEPLDTTAFERYFRETHAPLVGRHAEEIGFTRAVFTKFDRTIDGKKPPYYRKTELWFPSAAALERAVRTKGFEAVGADFRHFVTNGGPTVLVSHETNR